MVVRRPAVAGRFYPAEPEELRDVIEASYLHPVGPGRLPPADGDAHGVMACVCPHAGYEYSGPVAAHSYLWLSAMRKPELVVIVAPNHNGIGSGVATFREGSWETPLGKVPVDSQAAAEIVKLTGLVDYDPDSQKWEHSLEVQLPFLQQIYGTFKLLPISLVFQDMETTREIGRGLAKMLAGRDVLLIASSDLDHYETADVSREKDLAFLKTVQELDILGLYDVMEAKRVNSCGFGAIATVMEASRLLGFKRGELLKYANSGDVTGENDRVVGYPSVCFR
jgi:MEMO1 family protein